MNRHAPEKFPPRNAVPGAARRDAEQRKLVWAALLTVLAVHGLLLGLFRLAPRESPPEAGDLPAVGSIDLNARGNAALVQWLTIHDPALLTAPNREFGYSAAAGTVRFHHPIADLPNPPLLNAPEGAMRPAEHPVPVPPSGRMLRAAGGIRSGAAEAAAGTGAVTWNGRVWSGPAKALERSLGQEGAGRALPGKASVFELAPARGEGLAMRVVLTESCGDAEFDRAAERMLRRHLAAKAMRSGEVAVDWPRLAARRGGER